VIATLLTGKLQAEDRPAAAGVLGCEIAALDTGEVAGYGETQPRASARARPRLLGPVEAVEDAWKVLFGNSWTVVSHARL